MVIFIPFLKYEYSYLQVHTSTVCLAIDPLLSVIKRQQQEVKKVLYCNKFQETRALGT